ncbi:hypothetical protein N9192_00035 [Akkermansiaceae bacterium]|nr:hypothetical protein [Akkermansiaceae bacterium]
MKIPDFRLGRAAVALSLRVTLQVQLLPSPTGFHQDSHSLGTPQGMKNLVKARLVYHERMFRNAA